MLLDREEREQAEGAVQFHADALAEALQERTALDGPWGWLARIWRTYDRDVADCDARIAHHHARLQRAKAELAQAAPAVAPAQAGPAEDDREAVAERLRGSGHPLAEELRAVEEELAGIDAAHAQDARLHRTGAALVAAARHHTEARGGLTPRLARWLAGPEDVEGPARDFAAACRDAMVPFEAGTSLQSQADQAQHILAGLGERAIEHLRERRMLESSRSRVLDRAREAIPPPPPPSSPNTP